MCFLLDVEGIAAAIENCILDKLMKIVVALVYMRVEGSW